LYNLALEKAKRNEEENRCIEFNGNMTILAYADNIIILDNNQLEVIMEELIKVSNATGLIVN
jgi:hypothetical protein